MSEQHQGIVIRPPSEAGSFLLQVTYGCSHNHCTFCITYKFTKFAVRQFDKVREDIELSSRWNPSIRRVFLCDGDAMCLSTDDLERILDCLGEHFPALERVGIYTNARDILTKTPEELSILRSKKLGIAYLGLESGNDKILERVNKGASSEEMIQATRKAQASGIEISAIMLLGLGSNAMSHQHAVDSARAVNRMNPRYLSALTLMLLPGTSLYRKYQKEEFEIMNPTSVLEELKLFLENIEVDEDCVFRTNHASNYLPIGGTLPGDKERMLKVVSRGLADSSLLRPESFRAL
ncbi:MAG: radical SAM protein [Actinobacteria bacterium]|nr:radical SAM protein [Actinomycetota bacterium]MBU4490359.1 radical SAM protein [Actinomycetota bacterium]